MLARALLEHGHTIELWTSAFNHVSHKHYHNYSKFEKVDERISIQFIKGCGYRSDQSLKRFLHNRQTGREFEKLANNRKQLPDIIFAPVPTLELAEAAVKFAVQKKIPIIVDVRDLWPDVYLSMFPKIIHPLVKLLLNSEYKRAKFTFKNASGITAVSKTYLNWGLCHAQRDLRDTDKFYPLGSGETTTSNLVEPDKGTDELKQEFGIDHSKFIVTYVGTFSKFTDIQNILDAAKLLVDRKNIHIVIVGQGEGSSHFIEMAAQLPNVTMTGWLNAAKAHIILSMTNVGVAAYSKDAIMSLTNKPFEYMAAGLPLLSSLPGELNELIQENNIGRNYVAGDPLSLSQEILWFFEHPEETKNMGKNSIKLFSKQFRSDIIYKDFSEHLERIAIRNDTEPK
jgi:glycosyltransferase involved in cell wall biosynthesis